jgi:hypothetical protein
VNKLLLFTHGVVLAGAAAAVVPAAREALHWHWVKARDTSGAWDAFVDEWPASPRQAEAVQAQDEARWREIRRSSQAEVFENYVASARRSVHVAEAVARGDELRYQAAAQRDTVRSLQSYLDRYPAGPNAPRARSRQEALRTMPGRYLGALGRNSPQALQEFLADYPGHVREAEARVALQDVSGRDYFELLREKKLIPGRVLVQPGGVMLVKVRRTTQHALLVQLRSGTMLVPRDGSASVRLVLTAASRLLDSPHEADVIVSTEALRPDRAPPSLRDAFQLRPPTEQPKLVALLDAAARDKVPLDRVRLAVWVAIGNAGEADLVRYAAALQKRAEPSEVAEALRLVDAQGFDIRSRAIWRERRALAAKLPAGPLREWLDSGG